MAIYKMSFAFLANGCIGGICEKSLVERSCWISDLSKEF